MFTPGIIPNIIKSPYFCINFILIVIIFNFIGQTKVILCDGGRNFMIKRNIQRGWMTVLLFFTLLHTGFAEEAQVDELDLAPHAASAILMERDTGEIIYQKNAHEPLPPASMAKLMTLLLTMEAIDQGELKLDEMIRISERASSMGGSQVFLAAGEEMSVDDLLKSVAIASGNDASVALAERISGSEEAFVNKMNEKVKELGLENTTFQNSSGLPAENLYSTAHDMAMIAKELLRYETITDYTSIYEDYLRKGEENEFWLVNTNKLVRFYPGVDGLKTGYTSEAKYCLTATAEKDDMRIIAVVMGVDTIKQRNHTISSMLDYAYNHYEIETHHDKGEVIATVERIQAKNPQIDIVASEPIRTLHLKSGSEREITIEYKLNKSLTIPMQKNDQVGTLYVKNGDQVIDELPLVVSEDIERASYLTLVKRTIKNIAKNK